MEHGPIKRYYTRWFNIIMFCLFSVAGGVLLYFGNNPKLSEIKILIYGLGPVLVLFGLISAFSHWNSGYTFYRKSKVFPEDTTLWKEVDNGLVIIAHDWAKHIWIDAEKVKERGYIKMITQYNRKKEIKSWTLLGY